MDSPSDIVKSLLEAGELDPKKLAMSHDLGSDAFLEVMTRFKEHMHDLVKKAKLSGALSGDEPEILVLKCLLMIAAEDFFPGHIRQFKETYKNLRLFL